MELITSFKFIFTIIFKFYFFYEQSTIKNINKPKNG
jgi:hypothetical protein